MKKMLEKKSIIVTGGTSGIGKSSIKKFLEEGARVAFCGRSEEKGRIFSSELGDGGWKEERDFIFRVCNVRDPKSQEKFTKESYAQFGKIDGLFANAGIHSVGILTETSFEKWKNIIEINLYGTYLSLLYAIPYMKKSGGGNIVLMGSDQSLAGKGSSSAYGASKGAIGQLTKSTAIDYARDNIRVNCICPGTIDTPLAQNAAQNFANENFEGDLDLAWKNFEKSQPIQRVGTPEEIARMVAFLLSDSTPFMTGSLISVDGGYTAT